MTPDGHGTWRIGPLEAADAQRLHALAAALPPEGHALALSPAWPAVRVPEPAVLIRDLWDALADTLPRLTTEARGAAEGWLTELSTADLTALISLTPERAIG